MEGALEQEEAKVLKVQLEMTQLKQEYEKRLAEKDEDAESLRYEFSSVFPKYGEGERRWWPPPIQTRHLIIPCMSGSFEAAMKQSKKN